MKSMKVLVAALALCVMASVPALQAQEKKGRGMSPEQQLARIENAVPGLTADQKAKITKILAKAAEDVAALSQEDRRTKGAEIRAASNKEIRALLKPDQQKAFDDMPPPPSGKKKN